jgi:WXG100 family type VII secretion target
MTNIVNQLSDRVWSGEAADAYKRKFGKLQDDINKMVKMINEHVTDLNQMAAEYERAENTNKNMINSLKEDVIS